MPNVRAAFPLDAQYTPLAFLTAPIVCAFSCNDCNTQEKLRAILVHNFRVKQSVWPCIDKLTGLVSQTSR